MTFYRIFLREFFRTWNFSGFSKIWGKNRIFPLYSDLKRYLRKVSSPRYFIKYIIIARGLWRLKGGSEGLEGKRALPRRAFPCVLRQEKLVCYLHTTEHLFVLWQCLKFVNREASSFRLVSRPVFFDFYTPKKLRTQKGGSDSDSISDSNWIRIGLRRHLSAIDGICQRIFRIFYALHNIFMTFYSSLCLTV